MEALLLFAAVYLLHLVPIFAPPTWMAIALIAINRPDLDPLGVAVITATAATLGRITLALGAKRMLRERWMSARIRTNVDVFGRMIAARRSARYGLLALYIYCPASNFLFIAHGLTRLPLAMIALPFLLGRLAAYTFWGMAAHSVAQQFRLNERDWSGYYGAYFILTQCLLLLALWLFTRIDWRQLFEHGRLRLIDRIAKHSEKID